MTSFYRATVAEFLAESREVVLSRLNLAHANRGYNTLFSDQTLTWERDLDSLQNALTRCVDNSNSAAKWGLLLEFSIPCKELRIDAIILIKETIVVLEAKATHASSQAKKQIEEYALLLHYFHKSSDQQQIVPILVSSEFGNFNKDVLNQYEMFPQLARFWIKPIQRLEWTQLSDALLFVESASARQIDLVTWDQSPYFPVPSIIEAALALNSGLSIREIAHSEASEHEIESVRNLVQEVVDRARRENQHAICFITGVPGSGKTLVGLSIAHSKANKNDAIHFMSGNGPLVKVLQYLFTQEGMRKGVYATQAKIEAKTLIENVHFFARYHTEDNLGAPANHAIIFDEAQRAWNREQHMSKFKRDYSEPEMLLRIMERHEDWAVVIALVGGGQEIFKGEAGLEEWGRALVGSKKHWTIYASDEVKEGGASTAGHRLFAEPNHQQEIQTNSGFHLRTSNRSLRADQLAKWVNFLLEGKAEAAAALNVTYKFPIFLTRNLDQTRRKLREQGIGMNRYGLIGSSGADRLRAEGLETNSSFHADYKWEHWYLAPSTDIRSSFQCEVLATEFEIQGLELDWIGLCWGGDFIWDKKHGWLLRKLRHSKNESKWSEIKNNEMRNYRLNAYRVLLTRSRQGMVIFVPRGNGEDKTTNPNEFDSTVEYLIECGVIPI